jgi:hypothetical protein
MVERLIEVAVEEGGHPPTVRTGLSADDVAGIVRAQEGKPDATLTISREDSDGRLLIAVSGAQAFLGLDSPEGIFEFVAKEKDRRGTKRLVIGGQATDIESRSVVRVETAASVACEWLKTGRQSSLGTWDRK